MDILLIGGTGCLSSAVVSEALRKGIKVTIVTRGHGRIPDGVESIVADCRNSRQLDDALKNRHYDAVIDFLCFNERQIQLSFERYSKHTNQYLFISSFAVYNTMQCRLCSEDSPKMLPIWDYSVNKWRCEEKLKKLAAKTSCNYTVIRPGVTYGNTRIPYGIMPPYGYHWTLVARVLNDKPIIRWNGGSNRCNMMRVEDFAVGVVGLIGNPKALNEAFNICGDETPSFNDVLMALEQAIDHKVRVVDVGKEFYANEMPSRRGELLGGRSIDTICTNDKLKSAVPDFRSTVSLQDGIKRTVEAYKKQNYEKGIDWEFDADTDRIIKKWCAVSGGEVEGHIGFVDYIGSATIFDRIQYFVLVNKDNVCCRVLWELFRFWRRATRRLCR